jgi:hypothetical protein
MISQARSKVSKRDGRGWNEESCWFWEERVWEDGRGRLEEEGDHRLPSLGIVLSKLLFVVLVLLGRPDEHLTDADGGEDTGYKHTRPKKQVRTSVYSSIRKGKESRETKRTTDAAGHDGEADPDAGLEKVVWEGNKVEAVAARDGALLGAVGRSEGAGIEVGNKVGGFGELRER